MPLPLTEEKNIIFSKYVLNQLENYVGENFIIRGDFNIDIDINKSNSEPSKNLGYSKSISSMMKLLDVVDIWRIKHPNTIRYTRCENTHFGFKQT